jgi:steroid 5-alpha reductase family enzyme
MVKMCQRKDSGSALPSTCLELSLCSSQTLKNTMFSNISMNLFSITSISRKGLISDGMFKYTRNPNYLGEIMVYGSFVLLVNDWISYLAVC